MTTDMDWKDYTEQPAEGTFEKIEHRLHVRRVMRWSGVVAVVALTAATAILLLSRPVVKEEGVEHASASPISLPKSEAMHETSQAQASNENVTVSPQTVSKEAQTGEKSVKVCEEDFAEDIDLSSLLPQTMPEVQYLSEPQTPRMDCMPRYLGPAADSTVADIVIPATKSGEPEPVPYHEDDLLWAPNVLIPNGDVDENRTFKVKTSSELRDFNIHIYNRRGQRLFSSNNPSFQWDATYRGAILPQGAYVWVVTFRDSEGKACRLAGEVLVLR